MIVNGSSAIPERCHGSQFTRMTRDQDQVIAQIAAEK